MIDLLTHVFEPIEIGGVLIPNRIALSPINTSFGDGEGKVTQRLLRFHRVISRGGVGLSVVGSTAISAQGKVNYFALRIDRDRYISGLNQLFSAINTGGSIPAIQLMHAGRQTYTYVTRASLVAPSSIASPHFATVPKALKISEIEELIEDFVSAASRARKAGAKLVEFHGAHGYLIAQFLSRYSNRRNDEYGGKLKNRTRFFSEIIEGTKKRLGRNFPIICRLSVNEFVRGGIAPEDSVKIAQILVDSGADCISVSAGIYGQKDRVYPTRLSDRRMRFDVAEKMKKTLEVPIICGGRVANMFEAEQILREKKADVVALARGLIADPSLVKKSIEGDFDSISACTWCNKCTYDFRRLQRLRCEVNPNL